MGQHILVISQYFYPEEFRINDICREWIERGHEVTVVTGIPNYPHGKFYKGYGWFRKRREEYEGIHIIRIPLVPRGKSAITLTLNYVSFITSGFFWKMFTKVNADKVFIFEVSPMTQALVGVWYALKRRVPCFIYVQDLWPENVEIVTGIHNKGILYVIDRMVDYIYKNCTKILATSPSFVRRIEKRDSAWNGEESKVVFWPQYAEEFYFPAPRKKMPDMPENRKFKIVFTGNIGYAQGLDILPRTAAILRKKNAECIFIVIGDGRYQEEFQKEILKNDVKEMFLLLGQKKAEEVPYYLAWCDVAFISFADNPLFEMTIPAKLQSYMACGMPILASAMGETKRIIEDSKCGLVCELGNAQALAYTVIRFIQMSTESVCSMSNNALLYHKQHFNKKNLMDHVEELLG